MHSKHKRLSNLACASFTWLLGVSRDRTVSILQKHATTPIPNRMYYTSVGALRCKHLRIANVRETDTPSHLYGISHMSSVELVSRKCVRSVGAASSRHCCNAK